MCTDDARPITHAAVADFNGVEVEYLAEPGTLWEVLRNKLQKPVSNFGLNTPTKRGVEPNDVPLPPTFRWALLVLALIYEGDLVTIAAFLEGPVAEGCCRFERVLSPDVSVIFWLIEAGMFLRIDGVGLTVGARMMGRHPASEKDRR